MKTLLFTIEYPPFKGGVANYYSNLVKFWPEPENIFVLDNSLGKLFVSWLPFKKSILAKRELFKTIKEKSIDHILVGQILPLGGNALKAKKRLGVKYSVFLHGMDFAVAVSQKRKIKQVKNILQNCENIICVNSYVAKMAKQFLSDDSKIKIINPGISQKNIDIKPEIIEKIKQCSFLQNKYLMLSVGRLVERKGVDMVLKTIPQLVDQIPELMYLIGGTGSDEYKIKRCYNDLEEKYKKHVIFLGELDEDQKWAYMNLCDLFIMPSRSINGDFEGFGIVYLEANLLGKPVIGGDSGGVSDAVENGLNGLLVDPQSMDDIAMAVMQLYKNRELAQRLGKQGQERARLEFNWSEKARQIYNLLNI